MLINYTFLTLRWTKTGLLHNSRWLLNLGLTKYTKILMTHNTAPYCTLTAERQYTKATALPLWSSLTLSNLEIWYDVRKLLQIHPTVSICVRLTLNMRIFHFYPMHFTVIHLKNTVYWSNITSNLNVGQNLDAVAVEKMQNYSVGYLHEYSTVTVWLLCKKNCAVILAQ